MWQIVQNFVMIKIPVNILFTVSACLQHMFDSKAR